MWFLFLRAHGMKSFAHRKFNSVKDLVVNTNHFGEREHYCQPRGRSAP